MNMGEKQFNPQAILDALPEGVTPAQQDSAVQAHLPEREQVRSSRPDTLNLPGWDIPSSRCEEVDELPRCYEETFFKASSYYHPEVAGTDRGMVSEPLPYLLRNDDGVTTTLLVCFIITMMIFARNKKIVSLQIRNFFFSRTDEESLFSVETGRERRNTLFLFFQTGVIIGLFFFKYTHTTQELFEERFFSIGLLGLYALLGWAYLWLKQLLYTFVNWVFFDKIKCRAWAKSYSFWVSAQGVVFFPLALIMVYFNMPLQKTGLCFLLLLFFHKSLLFYKCFRIFYPNFHGFLHLIVYFCALEIMPAVGLWQALIFTKDKFL